MLTALLQAHSALRYVVLVLGIVAIVYPLVSVVTTRPYDRGLRIACASFAGLLHLQVLLGLVLVMTGRFSPMLIGHIFMMFAAAVIVQVPLAVMRRRPPEERTAMPHLVANVVTLALIWGGIAAIGRGILDQTFF
jgi:heme A synthase